MSVELKCQSVIDEVRGIIENLDDNKPRTFYGIVVFELKRNGEFLTHVGKIILRSSKFYHNDLNLFLALNKKITLL